MSGPSKNTTAYSASDISRYLNGEMSAREMHLLEKTALEDPFLADALEGFELQQAPAAGQEKNQELNQDLNQHLEDLQTRLKTRVADPATRRLFIAPWMRIAAALILLIGLGSTALYFLRSGHSMMNVDVARQDQASEVARPLHPTPPAAADSSALADTARNSPDLAVNLPRKTKQPASTSPPGASSPSAGAVTRATVDSLGIAAIDVPNPIPGLETTPLKKDSITYPGDSLSYSRSRIVSRGYASTYKKPDPRPLLFSGKVLDVHDHPLPGAILHLNGNSGTGAVTDQQGYFSMKVDPKDSVLKVTVGMAGYQQTSLAFNTLNTDTYTGNVIHLQEQDNALNEVVVVGYGSKRKETLAAVPSPSDEKIDSLWEKASPVIGKQAYLDYLTANKKTIGADSSIKGTVIISFDVGKKGALTAFKVEQSLTPAHDAGVIHLVSDGPQWKVSKGRSVRTAVRVVF